MTVLGELERAITNNIVTCQCFGGDAYLRCKFWQTVAPKQCVNPNECDQKIFPHWTLDNLTPVQRRSTLHNMTDLLRLEEIIKERSRNA